jgi:hypothetical protein
MIDRKLFVSWIRNTWLGWLLGIPIIIVLALIGEAVHTRTHFEGSGELSRILV